MTTPGDVLARLPAAGPRRLLEDLARLGSALAQADRARPEVECFLHGGHIVRGRIIAVVDDRGGALALIAVGGSARAPSVSYVRLDHVSALTIIDASLLVAAPVSEAPVPSKLELARAIAALDLPAPLTARAAADLDADARRAIAQLLPALAAALAAIAGDDLGRQALAGIAELELAASPHGEVARSGGTLIIHAPTLLASAFTAASLREALELRL